MMNCTKGSIDDLNFSKPMPIVGLYIAGATSLCVIAMAIDLMKGLKSKQFWIPARYFKIDAASLTVIGVAIKLSVDLNSPMPSLIDQLAKLSTSVFTCSVLANMLPSLGKLERGNLLANAIALAILIITSIVNLCIQLNTGVIHSFRKAHIFMIFMMSLFMYSYLYAAVYLPIIKNYLLFRFEKLHQQALKESFSDGGENIKRSMKMKKYLMKFSMMAQSSCPHFVMSRSLICMALSGYGLMPASALSFVLLATVTKKEKTVGLNTCSGESDYGWSVLLILIAQAIAVVIGLVAPLSRMIYYIKANSAGSTSQPRNEDPLEMKKFWLMHLDETKEGPFFPYIEDRQRSPIVYFMKAASCRFFSGFLFSPVSMIEMDEHTNSNHSNQNSGELRSYFLHVKGEEESIDFMMESASCITQKYITAEKREPKHLIELLENYISNDFGGVLSFENDHEVPPLSSVNGPPPNCWALPVLTMTCVAIALPNIDQNSKERLRKSLNEGLVYVKLVEDKLNRKRDLVKIRAAANIVWVQLDRKCRWFSIDLEYLARSSKGPTEVLLSLANSAKEYFSEILKDQEKNKKLRMQEHKICKAVAAHSMYRICQTILQDSQKNEHNNDPPTDEIFKKLCITMADILGACFTNLRQCILLNCKRSTIENRRETSFHMLQVFGETETIMNILEAEDRKIPDLSDDKLAFIDEWRSYLTHHQTEEASRTESNTM